MDIVTILSSGSLRILHWFIKPLSYDTYTTRQTSLVDYKNNNMEMELQTLPTWLYLLAAVVQSNSAFYKAADAYMQKRSDKQSHFKQQKPYKETTASWMCIPSVHE